MRLWRLYYEYETIAGGSRTEWDAAPVCGVQILMVKLDLARDGKSRVGWYQERPDIWGGQAFYAWLPCDDGPSGITPDAILDSWQQSTGDTSVHIADLSLDDLASIGVKCGRSISNDAWAVLLDKAINDPAIP